MKSLAESLLVSALIAMVLMWAVLFVFILAGAQPTVGAKITAWAVSALAFFIWDQNSRR